MKAVILPLLLTVALVAAGAAIAGPGSSHAEAGKAKAAEHRANATADADDNESDDRGDRSVERADRTAERANRSAERESFVENRTRLMDAFVLRLESLRASWHENATKVREDCHADNESAKHCVRDGYRSWREAHRVDMKELRAELRALIEAWHASRGRGSSA